MGELADHANVLSTGQILVDGCVLPGETNGAANGVCLLRHIETENGCRAGGGGEDGGQDAHGGGLARAIRPEETHHDASRHLETESIKGSDGAAAVEHLDEISGINGEFTGHLISLPVGDTATR